jgi:hypothetical protein
MKRSERAFSGREMRRDDGAERIPEEVYDGVGLEKRDDGEEGH